GAGLLIIIEHVIVVAATGVKAGRAQLRHQTHRFFQLGKSPAMVASLNGVEIALLGERRASGAKTTLCWAKGNSRSQVCNGGGALVSRVMRFGSSRVSGAQLCVNFDRPVIVSLSLGVLFLVQVHVASETIRQRAPRVESKCGVSIL